jgi:alpha-tubulin suppressor-like RCC1 family protein
MPDTRPPDRRTPEHQPGDDGVVLYNPEPKEPTAFDEDLQLEPSRSDWGWVLVAAVVLGLVGGYVAFDVLGAPPIGLGEGGLPGLVKFGRAGAEGMTPVPGIEATGVVGSELEVGVRVTGRAAAPLPDSLVRFRVFSGPAAVVTTEARTDARGVARTTVLLPQRPGTTVIEAELAGSSMPSARIAARAIPGAPARITEIDGDDQSGEMGEMLPVRLAVAVFDRYRNRVPAARVQFSVASGQGLVAPQEARTDSLGETSAVWRLGMTLGEQEVAATLPGLDARVVFTASATTPAVPFGADDPSTGIETRPVTVRTSPFVVGGSHVCSLTEGRLSCRGATNRGQSLLEADLRFVALATGMEHTCGLDGAGVAYCWGANDAGQLGDGSRRDRNSPVPVRTDLRFSTLAAGAAHTCGLAGGGIAVCWGRNGNGQLGDGTRTDSPSPHTVGAGLVFRTLFAGWNHTCGVTPSGNAWCWGANSDGQLGDGTRLDRLEPKLVLVPGSVEAMVAGRSHTCGIGDQGVLCWGDNGVGQLGDGTQDDRLVPDVVSGLPSAPTMLAAGAQHTCALVTDGSTFCWGQNLYGQLGDGTTENRASPVRVSGDVSLSRIHAGGALTCGLTTGGEEYCWGLNQDGQLGDGSRISRHTPTRVGG